MVGPESAMGVVGGGLSLVSLASALVIGGLCVVVDITAFSVAIQQRCDRSMLGGVMTLRFLAFAGRAPPGRLV
jgi:hypothetical protein